ncbi:MAG: helix-turn-helix domain-containing protein [Nitrospirota bacterium]
MKGKNTVGENIRKFRIAAGITQEELALRSGLSQGYINQLEYGKRNYTQKSLELIARSLSVPVIEFFREEEGGKPSVIAEKAARYKTKSAYKKEFLAVLKDLPEPVIDHYLILLKLERELLKSERSLHHK